MPSLTVYDGANRTPKLFLSSARVVGLFCAVLFLTLSALPLFAHKVSVFAYVENGTIYTESYFPDGKPATNSKIEVYNSEGRLIQEGRTDENGNYEFKIPAVEDLTIVLDASMGHRAEYALKSDELAGQKTSGAPEEKKKIQGEKGAKSVESVQQEKNLRIVSGNLTAEDVREIVREELAGQIEPVRRGIIDLEKKEKASVRDIFSGIGYILGLMGIALLVQNIKKRKSVKRDE